MPSLIASDGAAPARDPIQGTARRRILVRGIVQGVGFRPFVYNLARACELAGFVLNTSEGVHIEVEGSQGSLDRFGARLTADPPPLSQIDEMVLHDLTPLAETDFVIRRSTADTDGFALISPDVGTCDACLRDVMDERNRRRGYAFTNCTHCGPRYSIVRDTPYDRSMTTMADFRMCGACQAEYDDPTDRRYHAQPNACPNCGPALAWVEGDDLPPDRLPGFPSGDRTLPLIRHVRRLLRAGGIVAIKGLGGFHLACDAENDAAVSRLRQRKQRRDKPFALMARDLPAVERFCVVAAPDREALLGPRRPIVILPRRTGSSISDAVAPKNATLGVMLPYTPLHQLLFGDSFMGPPAFTALVMTSGNRSEEPIVTRNEDAHTLKGIADRFLLHDRAIHVRVDDSIVRTFEGKERLLRRSRAYAPHPIDVGAPMAEILACGAELKNTFCLTRGRYAFPSQHIGDLKNYETLVFFRETLERMKRLFRVEPRVVAHDLHPHYLSTQVARELDGVERVGVQHHHAHVASCMAENRLRGKVIGIAFDGTGYGADGAIWGGEFLIADLNGFERRAHFRYVGLPGGDAAVREPWRMALSYLHDALGGDSGAAHLSLRQEISPKKVALVEAMIGGGVNTPRTSSCGRLFDAVASLVGLRQETSFEGQAAIELETAVHPGTEGSYPFEIGAADPWQIDMRPAIRGIVGDLGRGEPAGRIAARFHHTVAAVILEVCGRLRHHEGLNRVCLTGGTFQNMTLLARTAGGLRDCGFEVFLHAQVPPNDGGISLGQALIANATIRKGG